MKRKHEKQDDVSAASRESLYNENKNKKKNETRNYKASLPMLAMPEWCAARTIHRRRSLHPDGRWTYRLREQQSDQERPKTSEIEQIFFHHIEQERPRTKFHPIMIIPMAFNYKA